MKHAGPKILIVDDDTIILDSLSEFLRAEGYDVVKARGFKSAFSLLKCDLYQLVIADVNLPDASGFELLRLINERFGGVATILMTGYGTIESAVDAIKLGAYDYLTKPIDDEELRRSVERALQQQALRTQKQDARRQMHVHSNLNNVVGQDYQMSKIFDIVNTVADSKVTMLITGESGTGKSLLARAIHQLSSRCDGPFIEVSCGAIPETLLESELFGHVKGAFTGAVADKEGKFSAADGGTIFLDEIATASAQLQIKLLRALQEKQFEPVGSNRTLSVDTRVILASNVDLEEEVRAGRFRQDLFYRVNVVNLTLPPLRERLSDIPLLTRHFVDKYKQELRKKINGLDDQAIQVLQAHHWPGNVRELQNVIERAIVFCKGATITLADLPPQLAGSGIKRSYRPADSGGPNGLSLQEALAVPERQIIEAALEAHAWNRQATADQLQINRTTLYKKMKRYGLDRLISLR